MSAYSALARFYDSLTADVPYDRLADFYEEIFKLYKTPVKTMLDLACGTGTLTHMLALRGYEMIGVDSSPDMLSAAAQKPEDAKSVRPVFICQQMEELDLYGTVDAVICALDGMNYVRGERLDAVFCRVNLFLEPGGVFIFDIHTPYHLRFMDGAECMDETDDVFCVWRTEFDKNACALHYSFDIFERTGERWTRSCEEHTQYAHEPKMLVKLLKEAGFSDVRLFGESNEMAKPTRKEHRVFITARKKGG